MDDPDVPRNIRPDGLFVHWIIWNIPPSVTSIAEHSEPIGIVGLATSGQLGYISPCPPHGSHRYYFRIYALDCELTIPSTSTKGELLRAMQGHILDQAELMGRYERK
jgi:Raf kinase inhibitor-like YbhB/YbcL family protein